MSEAEPFGAEHYVPATRVEFEVPGPPVPKGRAQVKQRGSKRVAITPDRTVEAEDRIRAAWLKAWRSRRLAFPAPTEVALTLYLDAETYRRGDIDNLVKLVMDALNAHAYSDDHQVTQLHVDLERGVGRGNGTTRVRLERRQPRRPW